jgi:hypothetical protein
LLFAARYVQLDPNGREAAAGDLGCDVEAFSEKSPREYGEVFLRRAPRDAVVDRQPDAALQELTAKLGAEIRGQSRATERFGPARRWPFGDRSGCERASG